MAGFDEAMDELRRATEALARADDPVARARARARVEVAVELIHRIERGPTPGDAA